DAGAARLAQALDVLKAEGVKLNVRATGQPLDQAAIDELRKNPEKIILGLDEAASLLGCKIGSLSIEDINHLPFEQNDMKAIEAYGKAMDKFLQSGQMSDEHAKTRAALRAEIFEQIPELEVVAAVP